MVEYLRYGSKGGVGTSTCAATSGLALGRAGCETPVVSTDPVHSPADAFEGEIGDQSTSVGEVDTAVEVDTAGEASPG